MNYKEKRAEGKWDLLRKARRGAEMQKVEPQDLLFAALIDIVQCIVEMTFQRDIGDNRESDRG